MGFSLHDRPYLIIAGNVCVYQQSDLISLGLSILVIETENEKQ